MSLQKQVFTAFAFLLGLTLLTTSYELLSARSAQEKLNAIIRRRSGVEAEIDRLRRALADNEQERSRLQQRLKAAHSIDAAPVEGAGPNAQSFKLRRGILAWTDLRYDRLFRKLGLTSEQIEQFETLVLNHQLALRDIAEAAKSNGVSTTDPGVVQLLGQETDHFHSVEAELLGDSGFQQLQEDNRTSEPRSWVNGLAGNVYFSDPLNAQQEDNLVQILADLSPGYQGGGTASTKQIQNWDAAFTQAQSVLSPAQLEAMRSTQATYQAGLQAVREALASQSK